MMARVFSISSSTLAAAPGTPFRATVGLRPHDGAKAEAELKRAATATRTNFMVMTLNWDGNEAQKNELVDLWGNVFQRRRRA